MKFFAKAVITGFGLAMGSAAFKKWVAPYLGLEENPANKPSPDDETISHGDGASHSNHRTEPSVS